MASTTIERYRALTNAARGALVERWCVFPVAELVAAPTARLHGMASLLRLSRTDKTVRPCQDTGTEPTRAVRADWLRIQSEARRDRDRSRRATGRSDAGRGANAATAPRARA